MKIIYNNIIPFEGFKAINLFGVIFARKEYGELSRTDINHETIHTAQMKELGYLPFYLIYGIEYLYKLIKYRDTHNAYRNVSFEKEAYKYQDNLEYLANRKHYAQWRKR